eukprot:610403-Alexandrium_andersonii.AAC.1
MGHRSHWRRTCAGTRSPYCCKSREWQGHPSANTMHWRTTFATCSNARNQAQKCNEVIAPSTNERN